MRGPDQSYGIIIADEGIRKNLLMHMPDALPSCGERVFEIPATRKRNKY